jgi:hypothetical protein
MTPEQLSSARMNLSAERPPSRRALAWIALAAPLALAACSGPALAVAPLPAKPADAPLARKGVGTVRFVVVRGDRLEPEATPTVFAGELSATLAQSGEGTLGDRLFRLDKHSLLEGCRYVPKGRVCELVTLPDGTFLGGNVHWLVPDGAEATARAGGWVARGTFLPPSGRLDAEARAVNSLMPVLVGQAFHCRFADKGPRCLPVPATATAVGYTPLGVFTLRDGAARRDVIWLGLFGDAAAAPVAGASAQLGIRELHRCETGDDADEVTCKLVASP